MPSNRRASIALLTIVSVAALGLAASAGGGCQILSGISDLEATGGADAGSSTGSKASGTTSSTTTSTGGQVCDPVDATKCVACGEEPPTNGCSPPYCHTPNTMGPECVIECGTQNPGGTCGMMGTGSGMTMLPPYCVMGTSSASGGGAMFTGDTNVMKMRFKCTGTECNGATLRCSSMTDTEFGRVFPCVLECAGTGSCEGTTFDCSQTAGTCKVSCVEGACEGLNLVCGENTCEIACENKMPPPAQVNIAPSDKNTCGPPNRSGCGL